MRSTLSILTGSGFSLAAGLPGVDKINQRLKKIDATDIYISSNLEASFLNTGTVHPGDGREQERMFVQEFLLFYSEVILRGSSDDFNYETFYDYYMQYRINKTNAKQIEDFCESFNKKYGGSSPDNSYQRIFAFNRTFSLLLASMLSKREFFDDHASTLLPQYGSFVRFLQKILETHNVKFHTLNHDLLFEYLCKGHFDAEMTDGFSLWGSPFYSGLSVKYLGVHKYFQVKMHHFCNRFDKPLCYYKLHGSIDNLLFLKHDDTRVRVKQVPGTFMYSEEVLDKLTGKFEQQGVRDRIEPDFLSGTVTKMDSYNGDHYKDLFNHFKENLNSSEQLLVIGYGFQDHGINRILEDNYLKSGKNMVIINPGRLSTNLIDVYQIRHVDKKLEQVTYEELLGLHDNSPGVVL